MRGIYGTRAKCYTPFPNHIRGNKADLQAGARAEREGRGARVLTVVQPRILDSCYRRDKINDFSFLRAQRRGLCDHQGLGGWSSPSAGHG
jgi:hypothetical protein